MENFKIGQIVFNKKVNKTSPILDIDSSKVNSIILDGWSFQKDGRFQPEDKESSLVSVVEIESSEGTLYADFNGVVLECNSKDDSALKNIVSVDLEENKSYWDLVEFESGYDILDLGLIYKDKSIQVADAYFREEISL